MLVLSRHKDKAIIIGDNIKIVVVEICGDKVRLGIEAPKNVSVHRQEVYQAILKERKNDPVLPTIPGHTNGAIGTGDMDHKGENTENST
jgi:carbon storage regulator